MVEIVIYPQRLFDRMVMNEWYKEEDFFLSIVHRGITEEDMPRAPRTLNHLYSKFDDVVEDVLDCKTITPEQAMHIVNFATGITDNTTVHVHCGAGVSRSTAAGKVIREILEDKGFEVSEKRLGESYHPNPTVYKLMSEAYKLKKDVTNG
jgi:predicted protein tyrosine phosphatase